VSAPVRRARVLAFERGGLRVLLDDPELGPGFARPEGVLVPLERVERRVTLPWKPRDLSDHLIVFRRRRGRARDYVEDLRVRRALVTRILLLLTERGEWRPGRGVEARHMYYSSFDWLSPEQLEQLLPEDGVPEDLNFQDIDEALPTGGLTRALFVDWLQEGRHDCPVAQALLNAWATRLQGAANESLEDFFERLLGDAREGGGEGARFRDGSGGGD
jgi:hypothetical protein